MHISDWVADVVSSDLVTKYGMSEKLGPLQYGRSDELIFLGRQIQEERNYSEETSKIIDSEVHEIIARARQRAYHVLTPNRDKLEIIVQRPLRSQKRRVGKECVGPCRSRWTPSH